MASNGRGPAEDVRRFVAELARRRVFQVVAIYGGVAFALLEGAALVVDELSLPPSIVTTLTVLVLIGFVIALGIGWLYDLDAAGRLQRTPPDAPEETSAPALDTGPAVGAEPAPERERPRLGWPLRIVGIGTIVLVVAASWFIATRILPLEKAYAVSDPRGSYLVAPIHSRSQSESELALADRAAGRLMFKLRGWRSVRVVQEFALSGMLYDLEIRPDDAPTLDQTFRMARMQQVGTVLGLRVTADADTAHLEAVLYDVATREEVGDPYLVTAPLEGVDDLVAPVARTILRLRDLDVGLEELRAESPDLGAHQDFSDGLAALYQWRLNEAEIHFRDAIATDSLFAAAHHYLAIALYWQTDRDPERMSVHGPEIARLTQAASRLAALRDLRPGLRDHVEAFRAFWEGDYEGARETYRTLLDRDPSDTEAWVLLGAVEFTDPYLQRTEAGELRPRRNPNEARRAFERAIKLSPDFQLSYGHLFALDRELVGAMLNESCPAFEPPDAPPLPPYLTPEAGHQLAYCPLMAASVTWLPRAAFDSLDLQAPFQLAQREMRRSRTLLENWVRIHPDQPRPHEELDRWLTWRRSIASCAADTAEIYDLTRAIRVHRERALGLRGDTTPEDRSRLALLRLATGEVDEALALLGSATPADGAAPASLAANIYLALGMTAEAMDAAEPAYANTSWGRRDPADGTIVLAGDVSGTVREIVMRGATGDDGPELRAAFQELMTAWTPPAYTRRQSVLMRETMMRLHNGVAPGLLLAADVRRAWFADWEAEGLTVEGVWGGLASVADSTSLGAAPARATEALESALARQRSDRRTVAIDHLAAGVLARAVGRDSVAAAQFQLVESCPLSLDLLDDGWGLRTLGRLYLARTLEALGDSAGANRAMNRFSVLWRGQPAGPGDPTRTRS